MFNICTESQLTTLVYVYVGDALAVYVVPFNAYELHAVILEEPVLLWLIIKSKVSV
jgi:hypothetical protein